MPNGPWDDYKSAAPSGPWDAYKPSAPVSDASATGDQPAPETHSALGVVAHGANEAMMAGPIGQTVSAVGSIPGVVKDLYHHPIDTVTGAIKGAVDAGQKHLDQIVPSLQKGDLSGAWEHFIGTIPVLGPPIAEAGVRLGDAFAGKQDPQTGEFHVDPYEVAGAVGHAAGLAWTGATMAKPSSIPKGAKDAASGAKVIGQGAVSTAKLATEKAIDLTSAKVAPETLMMGALRGSASSGRTNLVENLRDLSMPAISEASRDTGRAVNGIDSLVKTGDKPGLINDAKQAIQGKIDARVGVQKAGGMVIEGRQLGDALRGTITEKMRIENPAKVTDINRMADEYSKRQFSIDDAYKILGDTNDELNTYYSKNPVARKVSAGSNPDIAHQAALANALRDTLYKWEENPAMGDEIRTLRKQYGALTELEDSLYRRRNVALRAAPMNVTGQLSKVSGLADLAKAMGHAASGNLGNAAASAASGVSKMTVSKWMQDYISTDALINRAFAKTIKPSPVH